ncbi:MAG: Fe-S cluster assembly ATP-binding protein [Candidatus Peregrinibacteria bacterium Greene0416_62]|nr:MAG: Fe-S cluster assembly ATP-binding protein [Candidatus Peregrinibacteria bacterium Greene0416_62]TSC97793.1 MAG: Fe-S cluster assembly ATP-binding protein [Candidatus Peregrinibacteria bacterium Greene1014_49]
MSLLSITNLIVSIEDKEIIHGVSLEIQPGEVHAIMGPNGSGKSTLVNALAGHPKYTITQGKVTFQGKDCLTLAPHERAQSGMFLAMQYPKEIAGVTLRSFLFAAYKAQMCVRDPACKALSPVRFQKMLEEQMHILNMDPAFAERSVNKGLSGGEKKKSEILQMRVLQPSLALLDETDSGLDVDALKTVAAGVESMRLPVRQAGSPEFSALIVTHYARILQYIIPDYIHVMVAGKIVESGGKELAEILEKEGYGKFGAK